VSGTSIARKSDLARRLVAEAVGTVVARQPAFEPSAMERVAPEIGVEVVRSVTCPLTENVGVDDGAKKHADSDVHAAAEIRSRTTQPRLNIGIRAPEWIE
jgi:hypothetical protein